MLYSVFCPGCLDECECKLVSTVDKIQVEELEIEVEGSTLQCTNCGTKFYEPFLTVDSMEVAKNEYRRIKGWTTPDELSALRSTLRMNATEFAKAIGTKREVVLAFERGTLQTPELEEVFRKAFNKYLL